jgi:motility quorum-sensing regulator/GCU-specific mRNA interferase toxin
LEKRKPHYGLEVVQRDVFRLQDAAFTRSAFIDGRELGLSVQQMVTVVTGMSRSDFYKSMTTHLDHRQWQDVYHPRLPNGLELYVKVTYRSGEGPPVISFKER